MTKYLPTLLALLTGALPTLSPDIATLVGVFVAHNPQGAAWLVAALWAIYHFVPSPIQNQITGSAPPKL